MGNENANGEASVILAEESISVMPKFGEPILLSLLDIIDISPSDYRVNMKLSSEEELSIFDLGYNYENFVSTLFALRNEMILRHLLMNEPVRQKAVEAKVTIANQVQNAVLRDAGTCQLKLYETSLVVIPANSDPVRIPYSDIVKVEEKDYSLEIATEFGERLIISHLAREFETVKKALSDSINELNLRVQSRLKDLFPTLGPAEIRKASRIMKEGRAAKKTDIEASSPELWKQLEKAVSRTEVAREYEYLASLSQPGKLCVGIKRGLMGDLTGDYIWFLFPIYGSDPKEPGNAIAMEVARLRSDKTAELTRGQDDADHQEASESPIRDSGGNATYLFRIMSRRDYAGIAPANVSSLNSEVDKLISRVNRLMLDINFRREPIYLSEEKLREPQYQKYIYATKKIPSLAILRDLFIGRTIHSTYEQWKSDVQGLLGFNVTEQDDSAKWAKS